MDQQKHMKILVAEDQQVSRLILTTYLREWGYDVTEAANGLEALDHIRAHGFDFDMLITDWSMPEMDGLELASRVRSLSEKTKYIYIMLLTGRGAFSDIIQGFSQGGVDDYIVKPFEANELQMRIRVGERLINAERTQRMYTEELETIVRAQTSAIRETQAEIISRLFNALESRDEETAFHVQRIGTMSAFLGRAVGYSAERVDTLKAAAPLHDIGKIGVPDAILRKPGSLTPEEFEIIKEHTTIGARILSNSNNSVIQLAEIIAHYHHENWDGSGYPEGLKGEEIPLEARIVSITDVYDALRSNRVYRAGLEEEVVLDFIKSQRGIKFDPELCDLFLKHKDEIRMSCVGLEDPIPEGADYKAPAPSAVPVGNESEGNRRKSSEAAQG